MKGVRESAVAGSFYPSKKEQIIEFVKKAAKEAELKDDVSAAKSYVAPHAGYIYSGKTAAYAYKAMSMSDDIDKVETIVFVGSNHTGYGAPISVSGEDWETPLGIVRNDRELSGALAAEDGLTLEETAHAQEHSIEVQLPFMQVLLPKKRACFICMGNQSVGAAEHLSSVIAKAASSLNRRITVLASSDFNHYESSTVAERKDRPLFEQIERMDYKRFYQLKEKSNESSCGYGPIMVSIMFAKSSGARKGTLLNNSNSGDITGDYTSVVDYASFAFI
ncbi:MAG TPA: AmmeMemoRadiSam system protein B [Candidatus Acidoferrum sp.]|nr:AmmeMemoRadiSam system protein B [Candidatus Acidoferrum sp.]